MSSTTTTHLELDYKAAHEYVESMSNRGFFWEGWDIVRWVPNQNGFSSKNGVFKHGRWGVTFRTNVSDNGTWKLKNV